MNMTAGLSDKLATLKVNIFSEMTETVRKMADQAAATAAGLAPEGSPPRTQPRLKSSFGTYIEVSEDLISASAYVDNPHAAYVEFGTGRRGAGSSSKVSYDPDWPGMAAQPYMQPAADMAAPTFKSEAIAAVRSALKASGGRKK